MDGTRRILIWAVFALGIGAPALQRLNRQTGATVPLIVAAVAVVLLALAAALLQQKKQKYFDVFCVSTTYMVFTLLATAVLAVSGVMQAMQGGLVSAALGVLCMVGAVGLAVGAILQRQGKTPPARCFVPVVLFYALRLFRDFRQWMVDPAILDYCFLLFAMISFMLAAYHMGAFSFDRGNSRALTFFVLVGFFFGFASPIAPGAISAELFVYLGGALWMFSCMLQLQPRPVKAETETPEEPENHSEE